MFNEYIVVLKDDAPKSDVDKTIADVESAGGTVTFRYDSGGGVLNGFAAAIPDSHVQQLKAACKSIDSKIRYIQQDTMVQTT